MSIQYSFRAACVVALLLAGGALLRVNATGGAGTAKQATIILPTGNDALYSGNDSAFFMGTASGGCEHVEAGSYGFVRNPRGTKEGTIFTRYHAGMDIRPLYRDAAGRPLDSVCSISEGRVVHVSPQAGASNYGKYIVVEHNWGGSPYYSLYAHLNEIWVDSGQVVSLGQPIGRLGYTGVGINRQRAHLHFEINLLLSGHFAEWFSEHNSPSANRHGNYNGLNLVAIDDANFYRQLHGNPSLTLPEFLSHEEPYFSVTIPRNQHIDLLDRYPWMLTKAPATDDASWKISFTQYGLPLKVEPVKEAVAMPKAEVLHASKLSYRFFTKGYLTGSGESPVLSHSGEQYLDLLVAHPDTTVAMK